MSFYRFRKIRERRVGSFSAPGGERALWDWTQLAFACVAVIFLSSFCSAQVAPANFGEIAAQAAAAREQNNIAAAIELYRQATQLKPDWPDGWWFLGSLQYGTGQYAVARQSLSRYLELLPNAGPALAVRGLCEYEMGDYPQALLDIQRGLASGAADGSSNERIVVYHEALLLTAAGAFEDALRVYTSLARFGGGDPEMLAGVGLAGLRIPLLPKDVNAATQSVATAAGTAAIHYMNGDYPKAEQEFKQLFERYPKTGNAHYFYGYLLFANDPEQAVAEFKRELEVEPRNAATQVMLAWYFLLRDDPAGALPYAQKAVADTPQSPTGQLVLGRSLAETSDINGGIEHLKLALNLDPANLEIHLALAEAYSRLGRKEDARRERLLSLELTKGDPNAVVHP